MTVYVTYGSSSHTLPELARVVTDRLDIVFEEHDSHFRGVYFLGDTGGCKIEIQPNAIPGDHEEGDLYESERTSCEQRASPNPTPVAKTSATATRDATPSTTPTQPASSSTT